MQITVPANLCGALYFVVLCQCHFTAFPMLLSFLCFNIPLTCWVTPLSSDRQHLSYDVCLEVRGKIIRTVCFVLCTEAVHSHKHT